MKKKIKSFIHYIGLTKYLDKLLFLKSKIFMFLKNKETKNKFPNFTFPPDYYLYETYELNYLNYKNDGELTAKEIYDWVKPYKNNLHSILEWGCGVARVIRHFTALMDKNVDIYGVDINEKMIQWNATNINNIKFTTCSYYPPTKFDDNKFDLIYCISVFTHIEFEYQEKWIAEIHRILEPNGIFLFTTHGKKYHSTLLENEINALVNKGYYTKSYHQKGHRMMATYNTKEYFEKLLIPYFSILEYHDGAENQAKIGGQDLWIVQKK